ncbi:hypothetical protein, partial [Pedobacter sp. KBW06]|uniref:hypothetical protein n=1 Tax=Pedobacter sp. KBW06 TaxID=2153359 RepID=UPI001F2A3E42
DGLFIGYEHMKQKLDSYKNNLYTYAEKQLFLKNAADGFYDTQPDQFFFNFQGKSGSIIFDSNGVGTIMPYQQLKVVKDASGFTITDESGVQYAFGASEYTTKTQDCSIYEEPEFVSSWHLGSITTPSGESVGFGYTEGLTHLDVITQDSDYQRTSQGAACPGIYNGTCARTRVAIRTARLHSIYSGKNSIEFIANTKRIDLPAYSSEFRLDGIVFKYDGVPVKGINLEYNVFGCNRLRLDGLRQYDPKSPSSSFPLFKFEYINPGGVPCSSVKAEDHWGFANKNRGTSLIPPGKMPGAMGKTIRLLGADRSPDFDSAIAGVLNKITYGTGGYTRFDYESNDAGFINRIKVADWEKDYVTTSVIADPSNSMSVSTVTIDFFQTVTFEYSVNKADEPGEYPSYNEYVTLRNNQTGERMFINSFGEGSLSYDLEPGSYTMTAYSENPITNTRISTTYIANTNIPVYSKVTGGVRVAKITDHDGVGNNADMVKTYTYKMTDEPWRSSGVVAGEPVYDYIYNQITNGVTCSFYVRTANALALGSTKGGNVGYREVRMEKSNGEGTLYKHTTMFEHGDGVETVAYSQSTSNDQLRGLLLNKTDYKTTGSLKIPVREENHHYNITSPFHYRVLDGFTISYYRRSIGEHEIGGNDYNTNPYSQISQWIYKDSTSVKLFDLNGQNPVETTQTFMYDNPNHIQLTAVESITSDGLKETERTTYPLDYASGVGFIDQMKANHLVAYPVEKTRYMTSSSGEIKILSGNITTYKPGGKGLKEEELNLETINPIPLSAFKFSNQSAAGNLPTGNALTSFLPDPSYQRQLKINHYDTNSNIVEYEVSDSSKVALLWDYEGSFPVAQVKNAAYTDIAYSGFEAESKGNWNYAGVPLVSAVAATGSKVYQLGNGALSKAGLNGGKRYVLSYRTMNSSAFAVSGTVGNVSQTKLGNGWYQYDHYLSGVADVQLAGTGIVDEVRLYPAEATISTYNYLPQVGTTDQSDSRGQTIYYVYDDFQRLKYIKDQNGHIIKSYEYHLKP